MTQAQQQLADFQAALLDLFHQGLTTDEVRQRLSDESVFAPYHAYIQSFEPRMLTVAIELTKKWALPRDEQ